MITPQLQKLIDDANKKEKLFKYSMGDGKKVSIIYSGNVITLVASDTELAAILVQVLDLVLNGKLQRKPLTKRKN